MCAKARALPRFRPRILTLIVFFATAAVITLANLSYDEPVIGNKGVPHRSYGWPLIWHRIVLGGFWFMGNQRVIGWYCNVPRLAANGVLWLLLAALAVGCEWLLRRYRPRPRWSLRTLLAFVALVAVFCGWYAHAQKRAAIQDPLVGMRGGYGTPLVFVDRWGPKWLDILGMDRLRRRIVLASNWTLDPKQPASEQQFLRLARAPDLRHLHAFRFEELTPTTAKALGGMRQLETLEITVERPTSDLPAALSELPQLRGLSISWALLGTGPDGADDNDVRLVDECLAAIGNMTHLEALRLSGLPLHGKGLACLGGLKELKSLEVNFWDGEWKGSRLEAPVAEDSLRAIAMLTELEWLSLYMPKVGKESLGCLASLTNLKTLDWPLETHNRPMLSHLPSLPRLESFELEGSDVDDDDLRRVATLPRLKRLGLGSTYKQPFFTSAGLASLGLLDSLEELRVHCPLSPGMIESLGAIRGLKRLHMVNYTAHEPALEALRKSKPGLVIDSVFVATLWEAKRDLAMSHNKIDSFPERPAAWLPGGDLTWMTPQELAAFEQSGGRASFYGATYPGGPGHEPITSEF